MKQQEVIVGDDLLQRRMEAGEVVRDALRVHHKERRTKLLGKVCGSQELCNIRDRFKKDGIRICKLRNVSHLEPQLRRYADWWQPRRSRLQLYFPPKLTRKGANGDQAG